MLQLPLKRLRFNQISPFASNNKKFRNDIATERLSRQDKDIMELDQDPISIKSDGPTETTTEGRQEVRETGETTAPLADAVNQLSALLTRVKISDGAESAIPPFDGTYNATQFFQAFDRKMEDASMGEQEKLLRLPNYLARQPLELFRKLRMADRSYFQVRQILLDIYPESSEASFAKYFAMKLTGQANLETYYREKTAMGLQLGLPQEVILETLTEGLPFNDQRLVRVVPPENLGEWFRLVQRIHGPSVPTTRPREDQPPTMSGPYHSTPRRPGAWNAPLPPSNCKFCGARHWHSECRRRPVPTTHEKVRTVQTVPKSPVPIPQQPSASLSIVPYNIYHMLKTHLPNLTLEGHSLHLQTLNGFAKTMGKLSIPLTIGQITRKENFHVVNAPLPFGILSINNLHKFRLTIDFNKCTISQLGAPLSTLSYHFNHVSNVCTYWQCQAMSQKIFPASQLSAYDNHCVHSLRKTHLSTCPFFTKANCLFYMPSNNQTTTTSTYEPVQNAPTQRDNSHTKNIGDHTPLHNSHMTNPHNELDTHTNTQQNPLPHAYYNTTPNTHYTPQFTTLLQRYTHIFSQDKFNVPCLRIPPVKIPTNSEKIITIRPYRVPICDQQEIRNQIQQMLENGIIEQSFSPFSSPVTLVTKRDKTKRFCIDYRKVNELISSDVHPLPRIEDILDHLAQAKYFSTADISSAYWQVPIHPDSRPLLAFATFEGLYQPTRLPFGLKTSPQIYERAISQVLQRHGLDCVAHYFDDFIIYSNTLEEHQNHLRQFFAFCEAEKLQLNFAKCEFFKQSINFLGYTITAGTITPLTRNTDIIHAIKQPHNRKTLQSFLGAVNVYNKFIPEYARLRAPLNNLLKKDVVWNWNEACQEAFIDLKGNLTQHPILHLYKEGLPCQVYCDASTLGIAGILKQVHPDGNVYPAQYFSRTLRPHEKNYSISELECLAIVESVEKFRIYLMGRKFTIFSDHHALQWLKTIKNPSGRLFRWSLRLSSYEYEVRYIKGKLQYEADLLSRNPFCGFLDATLIKTHQPPPSKESTLTIDRNGLHTVSRKGVTKIILPKPLIQQLLQTVHTQYNHPGISQMSRIISTQYYWQGMSKDIKQKVKTCPTCQLTKRPVGPTYGELSQPPESKEPFDLLSLDTIAGFAKYGNTKIYLHVVVDHFSRYAWAFPSKSTSTTTYQQVLKRVFQDGSPKRLLTDRAPAFTSPKFRSFLLNRNIHPLITTSNNPQANGLCERLNATLTGKLRLLHLENPKVAWTKLVKKVTLIYNKTPHSTTGFPPIYLMFGILPPEISNHNTPYPDIDKARKIAHTRTQNKHLQDKNIYDQRHKQPHFEVGDLVLVKLYHHPNTGKLAPYFTGPHTILEIISPNVVRIDRPNQPLQRDTDTIHVNKLKLYTEKIRYISPPAVSTYHIKHNPNYTFPFKHLTPELFPTKSLRFKPTSSEPFRHLDPAIFATRRFASLFPDVKNCKPDNQLNHITPLPKDIKQENCEPTNHSNSTINKSVKKPTAPSYGLMGNLPLAEKPFDVVARDSILGLGDYNSTKNCLHVIVDHHIWAYPSKSQGKLMPAFYPEPYTIISIPSPQTIEIDKPCQPENKHATIVNISKVKLWDPVTEDNTEPPFPFQEEEDLEGCLGVEPNKQASTDSPQVLFSSIKNTDHPIEPLEKLLRVSVDTQTESEPVVFCEVYQRLLLEQQKLLELLEGLEIKPNVVSSDSNSESSLQNWKSKDVKARMLFSQAIELKFLQPLMNCTSASQMWQKLLAIHEQKSEFTIGLLWQQLFDARLTSETISNYIAKIENISAQISQMGGTITEDQKVAKILNTLPSSMRYFVAAWESLDPKAQTLNNLTARLLIEETRNQQSGSSKQDEALLHRQARTKPKDTQRFFQDAKKNTKCHYCHKIGHWSRECRKRLANEKNKSKNLHDSKGSSSDYGLILCDNQVEPNDIWYADSGASCSMTFRREWFKTYTPFTSDHPIYMGDNSTLLAEGMGDIEIQAYVDGGWYNTYIRNVLYSPQLKKNLYSFSTSTRRGFNVIIKHDKLQIFMDNDLKAVGVRHDGLYRMLFKVTSSSQGYITSENKLQLWHERLAHLPVATLREMATKGLVDGLQPQDLEGDFFFCEGCQLGKAHRKSCYPSDGKNYQLGEFIYADISGPMQTQSLSKYLYFCLFKDYFSGYRHIYFIKNKSDVLDIFKEYATLIYTQTGNKIKVLRTDNALEFKSDNFADLCKRFGIIHEFTAPYVHEQIGRIERDNRTIVEAARSMLNSRNLPGFFWAEACNTATYILNRSATKQTPGTTPYELLFGTKPNVANYKIFGCNAYMHIPKENRKKWDNKSIKLMFLGYENTSKNFRLWDWKTRKIRISKDVTFDEKATPHSDRESTKPKEIIFQINSAPDESPVATTNIPVQEMLPVSDISSHPMITRSKVSNSQCNFALADEPSNYIDAITSSDSERWKLAMDEEIDALNKNKTWTLERLADGHKPIGCKWVYKIKTESDGTIKWFKARLVAKGYSQIKNVDYFDTFSPVVRYDSLRILLSHTASERMFLKQFDVKTAFLNGELEELVYLEQPEGYKRDDNSCYRLHKTLYVDDGIILSKDKEAIAIIMDELEHAFDITSGSVNFFVGLQIEQSEDRASIFIHQSSYIDKILSKFNMADCIPASVPMDPSVILTKQDCPTPEQKEKMPKFPFREAVGSLMFASCVSRPDITYAVSRVSKFLEYPGPAHCTTVKNIFRYLKGTPHMGILFTGQDQLVGYSDSDFARDVDSRKSTTGYAFMMNGGTVSWASQRQPIIALSTTESEYIAACSAAKELIWIRRLLQGIGCDITKETELYIDNQAAIKLVENPVFHKRTKHIDVRYHFIRSKHEE
ncbi:hypothetical protein LAZ67_10001674, partial [Cordylochernes scorpioides]